MGQIVSKETRYQPRHAWYLADALLLIRRLQAALWPLGWHVALGGGVLNHGYSDKDVDIYVLPIYRADNPPDTFAARHAIQEVLGAAGDGRSIASSLEGQPNHECFAHSVTFEGLSDDVERIDVFVVRP